MKNATKYAEDMKSLLKRLLKEHKPEPMQKLDPLKALVKGAMSYDVSDTRAEEAMRHIDREFVDLNELRVATDLEIQELLGVRYPQIEKRVAMITQSLNFIFEREHTMNLERLGTISRRDARQFLRELPDIHPFVEAFVMLYSFEGNCVPLDEQMVGYLREREVLDEKLSLEEAQKFVEHHLKGEDCHDFYKVVRRAAHEGSAGETPAKKKAKAK
jgi:endonuclease III